MRCLPAGYALVVLVSCGPSAPRDDDDDDGQSDGGGVDAGSGTGSMADAGPGGPPPPAVVYAVYAHSSDSLYRVDPDSLEISLVGPFQWPIVFDSMTDIAIDKDGVMIGISFDKVYRIDPDTALCTYLAPLDRSFNGLSFIPDATDPDGVAEKLVAAALDGSIYAIDPGSGVATYFGAYGGYGSSGDVVSVQGFGTVATVTGASDVLVRVNPATGAATPIGATGVKDIWGLGFWKDKVYGFTAAGQFVLVDVVTGVASIVETGAVSWWGAGVTTSAPVVL
jgi:hypothetical protein